MAGEFSTAGANLALDAVTGRATVSTRTTYLALLTTAPTDATTMAAMTEVFTPGASGYARQAVTWAAPSGDPSATSNTGVLTFGAFTADPASVTHCALVDAATGTSGNVLAIWSLATARDAAIGDTISFAAGALTLTCD
jgi:hypothetical protein